MGEFESKLHNPGVKIYRVKGKISDDDVEKWRDELTAFVKSNKERGACGVLVDVIELDSLSIDGIDSLMEILSDPEELMKDIKMRFALIGVKPFTQRFLRETMTQIDAKHIRAKFFHEVSEGEAIAWLQAMVSTAEEASGKGEDQKDKSGDKQKASEPEKPKEKEPEKKQPERRSSLFERLKGEKDQAKPADKAAKQ